MASDGMDIAVPECYKQVKPYVQIAKEHETRDPIVSYYARRYAMETAMQLKQSRTPEVKAFLFGFMDILEKCKTKLQEEGNGEAIMNEIVGSAHVENYALKIFLYADNEDRAGNFNKNTIKAFYKAGLLLDIMQTFDELTDDLAKNRKYAKWKATYISGCLKRGETPHAGPLNEEDDDPAYTQPPTIPSGPAVYPPPQQPGPYYPPQAPSTNYPPAAHNLMPPGAHAPPTTPEQFSIGQTGLPGPATQAQPASGVHLSMSDFSQAQKFCKYAGSALEYEDVSTAIENLEKALQLLRTGKE